MRPPVSRKVVRLKPRRSGLYKFKWIWIMAGLVILVCLLFKHYYVEIYTVKQGTINKSVSTEAVMVKNETVINSPADGELQLMVKPGERVRVGTPLFMVVTAPQQKEDYEKQISYLQKNIKDMQKALNSSVSLNALNKSIDEATEKLKAAIKEGQFDVAASQKKEIARLTNERQQQLKYSETSIKTLEENINNLKKKLSSLELLVKSPVAGIVSFNVDGMENILTPDNVNKISTHQLQSIDNQPVHKLPEIADINRPILKIVDNFAWYLVADVRNCKLKVGKSYEITIKQSEMNEKIKGKLLNVHDTSTVGVFMVQKDIPEMMEFRKVNLEIVTETATGNMIPLSGLVNVDGNQGVYLIEGGSRVFRPVEVVASNDSYAIVEGLKLGDKILLGEKGYIWKNWKKI